MINASVDVVEHKRYSGGKKQYDDDRALELRKEKSESIVPLLLFQGIVAVDPKPLLCLDPGQAAEGCLKAGSIIRGQRPEAIQSVPFLPCLRIIVSQRPLYKGYIEDRACNEDAVPLGHCCVYKPWFYVARGTAHLFFFTDCPDNLIMS